MKFDVRIGVDEEITEIIFADDDPDIWIANKLTEWCTNTLYIRNDRDELVAIKGKEHAENLIKALQKAIEIGWLK